VIAVISEAGALVLQRRSAFGRKRTLTKNATMALTAKQKGVLRGILLGATITVVVLVAAIATSPISFSPEASVGQRIMFALKADLLVALWLALSIGRLAHTVHSLHFAGGPLNRGYQ